MVGVRQLLAQIVHNAYIIGVKNRTLNNTQGGRVNFSISDISRHIRNLGITALLVPMAALGHHSAAQFDFSQNVEVSGTVEHIAVENPHIDLVLAVESDDGSTREIQFEGHSRNNVYRKGWRPGMIERGQEITIRIAPMRNGEDGGYIQSFVLGDGTEF